MKRNRLPWFSGTRVWLGVGCVFAICHGNPIAAFADGAEATAENIIDRGTFVLIYDAALNASAIDWAAYRAADGWRVIMQPVESTTLAAAAGTSDQSSSALNGIIREQIRAHWRLAKPEDPSRFMVMILGDANSEQTTAGVPTWRFPQTDADMRLPRDRSFVSDHPYQLMDDADELADVPLGRVPARTDDEARLALAKIREYELRSTVTTLKGAARVTYVAGEGHYGLMDSVLESMFKSMVDQLVPAQFDVSMTYAKATSPYCPPPSQLSETVLTRLGEGCVLFNYVGHGFERGFDALVWRGSVLPILRTTDLARLEQLCDADALRPIALLTCCSTGWFDLPNGTPSMAEALLFNPCGPVAVIAGSRVTHPYANIIVQKDVTTLLLREGVDTVGMIDLLAARSIVDIDEEDRQIDALAAPIALAGAWKTTLADLRQMHARLYNLLGDPATRVSLPPNGVTDITMNGSTLTASVSGMQQGEAEIVFELPRTSIQRAAGLVAVTDANDPELESKAARNYLLANDRVVLRMTAPVRDGRLETLLSNISALTPGSIIRVEARGTDAKEAKFTATGAIKITPRAANPPDDSAAP